MNVTLGVPRVQEIINAAKMISTPIITAELQQDKNKVAARIVKAVIEKTSLGEVSKYIKEVYSKNSCYVSIELDLEAIAQLKLNIDAAAVRDAILKPGSRNIVMRALSSENVQLSKKNKAKLRVYVPNVKGTGKNRTTTYFSMQILKTALPVRGINTRGRRTLINFCVFRRSLYRGSKL
jgi:DNA-directed RNA polymerase III subunit RPC1